jgi:hypothetical protein
MLNLLCLTLGIQENYLKKSAQLFSWADISLYTPFKIYFFHFSIPSEITDFQSYF